MVLTRRQERALLEHQPGTGTPLGAGSDAACVTPSPPARGVVTLPGGRLIKSALKSQPTKSKGVGGADDPATTPADAGIKKRVRIHSRDNTVHVFERSQVTEDAGYDSDGALSGFRALDYAIMALGRDRAAASERRGGAEDDDGSRHAAAVASLLAWAVASSWLIFFMRDMMTEKGMPFPLFLPAVSQLGAAGMAWAAGWMGLVSVRPWPPARDVICRLLPLALSGSACMYLGNFAYLGLSIAFLSILKALTPAVTLMLSAAAGTERFTAFAFAATLLIAYGTAVATIQETTHNVNFHWPSFISFTSSILFEALRVVFAARLLGGMAQPYNPIEVLAHVGLLVCAITAVGSWVLERHVLALVGVRGLAALAPELALVCVLSFLVNVMSYVAIRCTSSTTFKVAGCFKNVVVLWLGVLGGDVVTPQQLQGFGLSTGGFLLYTWARSGEAQQQAAAVAGGKVRRKRS